MALSSEDVRQLAYLSRIEITTSEVAEVRQKLERILELIDRLRGVDTTGIVPMSHAQEITLPLRADVVTEADQRACLQALAPAVAHGLYLVPKVIE